MTEDRLDEAMAALERVGVPVTWEDVERRLTAAEVPPVVSLDHVRPRWFPARPWALPTAGVVLGALMAVVLMWPGDDTEVRTSPGRDDVVTTTSVVPPSPPSTAPATSTHRGAPATAFSGTEYLVWAGEAGSEAAVRADGFAVDVATGAVRPIPAAPIDPRSGPAAVWTGTELIVCCGYGRGDADVQSAAAWSPATGEWRTLARPPAAIAGFQPASVWTGDLVVMATGPAVAIYDPAADRWTEVAEPPSIGRLHEAVWTGEEVILWDSRYDGDHGWRWAPGRASWEPMPELPAGALTSLGDIGWSGTELVVWGESTSDRGLGVGARWRPGDDAWRPVSASPQGRVESFNGTSGSQIVVSDPARGQVVVRGVEGDAEVLGDRAAPLFAYDPATDRWTPTELVVRGYHPSLDIAGDVLVVPDEVQPILGPVPS